MKSDNPGLETFEYQPPAVLDRAGATVVQDTWYPVLGTLLEGERNVRVYKILGAIITTGEDIEVQAIVDGETIEAISQTAVASTDYLYSPSPSAVLQVPRLQPNASSSAETRREYTTTLEGREVQIQIRKTTNNGNGNLRCIVTWGQK